MFILMVPQYCFSVESQLSEYLIGTGGWAYFHIPGLNPLTAYSRAFDFVEVNSTFYTIPPLGMVNKWRLTVPSDFHFAVRANRAITHEGKFDGTHKAVGALRKMKEICSKLKAELLHLQSPPSLDLNGDKLDRFLRIVRSVDFGNTRLALEVRSKREGGPASDIMGVMKDNGIVHSVDVSKGEMPAYRSDTLYTRLFGPGEKNIYQPTDGELAEIDRRVLNGGSAKIGMSFHFVRMYKDAARMKMYKQTGRFPKITGFTGPDSLREVLSEDAKFPSTKEQLVESQGWKLFDISNDERIHARDCLEQLPEGTYQNVDEIISALHFDDR